MRRWLLTPILVVCESCGQRVGVWGRGPDGRRRLASHKVTTSESRSYDWCEGRFERQEVDR